MKGGARYLIELKEAADAVGIHGYLGHMVELREGAGNPVVRVQLLREGKWKHPQAPNGELSITPEIMTEFRDHMVKGTRGFDLPCDSGHADPKKAEANSWIKAKTAAVEDGPEGKALFADVEIVDAKLAENIKAGKVRYFSPELLLGYMDPELKKSINAFKGGSWTNMPHIKRMAPPTFVNLQEVLERDTELKEYMEKDQASDPDDDGVQKPAGSSQKLSDAKDPDASNQDLPQQCMSCSKLFDGSCPFAGIDIKVAAAGDGICPQYESDQDNADAYQGDPEGNNVNQKTEDKKQAMTLEERLALLEKNQVEMQEASDAKIADLQATIDSKNSIIASLQTSTVSLEEKNRLDGERRFVDKYVDSGKLTPQMGIIVHKLLQHDRGIEVRLTEDGSGDPCTTVMLLEELIECIETDGVDDTRTEKARRRVDLADDDQASVELDEKIQVEAKKIAAERGGKWEDHYGQATRNISIRDANAARARGAR